MKKMTVKNYASIVKNAPKKIKAQGKATIKAYGANMGYRGNVGNVGYGGNMGCYNTQVSPASTKPAQDPFFGPSLRERLRAWAKASIIVTVALDRIVLRGRIISVDGDGFEMTITERDHKVCEETLFPAGSIVFVSFKQVNAVAAGGGVL